MGQELSNQDGRAWENDVVALRDRVDRRPNGAVSSGLNDVIQWLDSAELSEQVFEDGISLCGSKLDSLHADSHQSSDFDDSYPSKSIDRHKVVSSQSTDRLSRMLEQDLCCRGPARHRFTKEGKMLTMGMSQEETEWEERQRTTGAAARLVAYESGEAPQDDLTLRGGAGQRIVVAVVREEGPAFACGVRAGDLLVSIDGKKDFVGKSADDVQANLRAPVVLVFLGFVGKLAAEVRLGAKGGTKVGIPSEQGFVCRPDHRVAVADEVVFQASGPLLLATPRWAVSSSSVVTHLPSSTGNAVEKCIESIVAADDDGALAKALLSNDTSTSSQTSLEPIMASTSRSRASDSEGNPIAVYELLGSDARHLIRRALGQEPMTPLERTTTQFGSRASTGLVNTDYSIDTDDIDATLQARAQRGSGPRVSSQTLPWQLTPVTDTTFRMGPSFSASNNGNAILDERKPFQADGDLDHDCVGVLGPSKTAPRGCENLQLVQASGASPVISPATSTESSPREA